jgi:drug/metabolite transporter (DMT)-like permease
MWWNYGIEQLGPARAGSYMYLNGVFTVILAFVLLGEVLRPYHGLGTVLIVFGVWYSERHAPA